MSAQRFYLCIDLNNAEEKEMPILADLCPDCGKPMVREADEAEQGEYERIQKANKIDIWFEQQD